MVLSADFITNRDQMCVYTMESVGWIFIIAICGDLFTPLARVSRSWCCKWAVLLHNSDTELPKSFCSLVSRMGSPHHTQDLDILLSAPHLNWDLIICEMLALLIPTSLHLCLYPSLHRGKHQLMWGCCDTAQPLQSPWSFCPSPAKHPASWWIQAAFAGISSCVQLLFYDLCTYPGGVNITYSSHNSPRQLGDLLLLGEDD